MRSPLNRVAIRRLHPIAQFAALLFGLVILAPTPVGSFVRNFPLAQTKELVRFWKKGVSYEDLQRARLGPDYDCIQVLREDTPEDAVILLSDRNAPSVLNRFGAKSQEWSSYFLYPRRLLYLDQVDHPYFAEASWLLVDSDSAVSWMPPEMRIHFRKGFYALVPFDMAAYLASIDRGEIDRRYLPAPRAGR